MIILANSGDRAWVWTRPIQGTVMLVTGKDEDDAKSKVISFLVHEHARKHNCPLLRSVKPAQRAFATHQFIELQGIVPEDSFSELLKKYTFGQSGKET